jgi:TPR repeat protein
MRTIIVSWLVWAGCAAPAPRAATEAARTAAPSRTPTAMERAEALERGDGVARDYQAAADIYRASCADGSLDLAACPRLLRAELGARGVTANRAHVYARFVALSHNAVRGAAGGAVLTAELLTSDGYLAAT